MNIVIIKLFFFYNFCLFICGSTFFYLGQNIQYYFKLKIIMIFERKVKDKKKNGGEKRGFPLARTNPRVIKLIFRKSQKVRKSPRFFQM